RRGVGAEADDGVARVGVDDDASGCVPVGSPLQAVGIPGTREEVATPDENGHRQAKTSSKFVEQLRPAKAWAMRRATECSARHDSSTASPCRMHNTPVHGAACRCEHPPGPPGSD